MDYIDETYSKTNQKLSAEEFYNFQEQCTEGSNYREYGGKRLYICCNMFDKEEIYDLLKGLNIVGSRISVTSEECFKRLTKSSEIKALSDSENIVNANFYRILESRESRSVIDVVSKNKVAIIMVRSYILDEPVLAIIKEKTEDGIFVYRLYSEGKSKISFIKNSTLEQVAKSKPRFKSVDDVKNALLSMKYPYYLIDYDKEKNIILPNEWSEYYELLINKIYREGLNRVYKEGQIFLSENEIKESYKYKKRESQIKEREQYENRKIICNAIMKILEIDPDLVSERQLDFLNENGHNQVIKDLHSKKRKKQRLY